MKYTYVFWSVHLCEIEKTPRTHYKGMKSKQNELFRFSAGIWRALHTRLINLCMQMMIEVFFFNRIIDVTSRFWFIFHSHIKSLSTNVNLLLENILRIWLILLWLNTFLINQSNLEQNTIFGNCGVFKSFETTDWYTIFISITTKQTQIRIGGLPLFDHTQ